MMFNKRKFPILLCICNTALGTFGVFLWEGKKFPILLCICNNVLGTVGVFLREVKKCTADQYISKWTNIYYIYNIYTQLF